MTGLVTTWRATGRLIGHPRRVWWPAPHPLASSGVVHGASAGEVKAALALRSHLPGDGWTVTTGTAAGLKVGAEGRLPRDVPASVAAFFDRVAPERIVLIEGDLWPTLLQEAQRRGVPVGVAGARLSPRSAVLWARAPRSARTLFSQVDAFAAASGGDAARLIAAGAPPDRVRVCGLLKWPGAPPQADVDARRAEAGARFGARPVAVAGSVHPGELTALAESLRVAGLDPEQFAWLVAPRHEKRRNRIQREARLRLGAHVWVERRFGVLRSWYGAADVAFVGGGGRGRGVHDLLEPLAAGRGPLYFANRGDPGDVGADLGRLGAAHRLDGPRAVKAGRGLEPPRTPWARIQSDLDGRRAAVRFLCERGVLPGEVGP